MKAPAGELVYKRLRAPARSGASLLDPPLPTATEALQRNVEQFADAEHDVQGRPLRDLRTAARSDVWKLARPAACKAVYTFRLGPGSMSTEMQAYDALC